MQETDPIPLGWGVSWYLPEWRTYRIHPIPFNWVFGWSRDLFYFLSSGFRSKIDARWEFHLGKGLAESYKLGYKHGGKDATHD